MSEVPASHQRVFASRGIVFVLVAAVGAFVVSPPLPPLDSSPAVIASWYADHQPALQAASIIVEIATADYLLFVIALTQVVVRRRAFSMNTGDGSLGRA
jgi:hypothetical protein